MPSFTLNPPTTRAPPWRGDAVSLSQAVLASARAGGRDLPGLAAALRATSTASLAPDAARAAFWINLYNALLRHALARYGVGGSLRWHPWIFFVAAYEVGGRRYTLHTIEHGLLRGNRPVSPLPGRPLRARDPRLDAAPSGFDPRVHFALHCGARSCPPVRAYAADTLDAQLAAATRSYVAQETSVDWAAGVITLPRLCRMYLDDFGGVDGVLDLVRDHHDEGERIGRERGGLRVAWGSYDWTLVR
jgi:hypothetical protein